MFLFIAASAMNSAGKVDKKPEQLGVQEQTAIEAAVRESLLDQDAAKQFREDLANAMELSKKDERPQLTVHIFSRLEDGGLVGLVRVKSDLKSLMDLSRNVSNLLDSFHILPERNHFIIRASNHHPSDVDYHPDGKSVAKIVDLLHQALEPHFRLDVTYEGGLQATVREMRAIYPPNVVHFDGLF